MIIVSQLRAFAQRHRRFVSFCAVGASGVLVNLAVFAAVLAVLERDGNAGSWLVDNAAVFAGWFVSVASNFALNDRLTFRDKETGYNASLRRRLVSYYTSAFAAFLIQWACFNGLLFGLDAALSGPLHDTAAAYPLLGSLLGFRRTLANLCGIGVATIANYLLAKHWVFKAKEPA
ncbi:MAG: GtrA family protein [Myxococcales bacterium]|nr:GtrA family protein [Myxococcales bacterium]